MSKRFELFSDNRDTENHVIAEIIRERDRQVIQWGLQSHSIAGWMLILGEEYGEACHAGNDCYFRDYPFDKFRKELIQTSAVAVAILESIYGD